MSISVTQITSSKSLRVLSESSLAILRTRGESTELTHGVRLISNSSYISNHSTDTEATAFIPECLESLQTLHFLELNKQTADSVWKLYLDDAKNLPQRASTLRSARRYVESVTTGDINDEDDQWWSTMQAIGVTSNFGHRIMEERYRAMRLSSTLKEIIIDMFEMRYEFLESLDDVIKTPSKGISCNVSRMGQDGILQTQIGPAIPPRLSYQPPLHHTYSSASSSSSQTASLPARPESLPDCTIFLQAGTLTRLQRIHAMDNSLNFRKITSIPPGDFSCDFRGVYLTNSHQAAWQHARWTAAKANGLVVPVGLLYVAVPKYLLASSAEIHGEDWRWVWACRSQSPEPADLSHLTTLRG